MKVLLAGASLREGWGGGEPLIVEQLLRGLPEHGYDVEPYPTSRTRVGLAAMAMSPVDWDLPSVARYRAVLRRIQPDVVLGFYDFDSSLLRAALGQGIPYVAAVHIYWPVCPVGTLYIDGEGTCNGPSAGRCLRHMSQGIPPTRLPLALKSLPAPLGLPVYLKTRVRAAELNRAQGVVTPGERTRELLTTLGVHNVHAIPNGIPVDPAPIQPWSGGQKSVLFAAGAPSERKGFSHFEQAARQISTERSDVEFVATSYEGSGPVRGLGRVPYAEVLRRMRSAYMVVVPALWEEPWGLVAQEAMGCGKPVVAYDTGALRELIGESGALVPRGDQSGLTGAIRGLLDDESRASRLGRLGRDRAERLFGPATMVERYAEVLNTAAGPRS